MTNKSKSEEDEKPKKLDLLVQMVESSPHFALYIDQYGDAYIRLAVSHGYPAIYPIRSRIVKNFIKAKAYGFLADGVSKENMESLCGLLEGKALSEGKGTQLNVRIASHNDKFYYDLGTAAIKILAGEPWTIEQIPPPIFRWYSISKPQVVPNHDYKVPLSDFLGLWELSNKGDRLLLECYIITCFIPDIPHALLAIYGDQGSAKSTLMRLLVRLIDPCATEEVQITTREELIQAASHRHLVPLDNLRGISRDFSDLLCKIVTGSGSTKRKLYTDDEDIVRNFRRVIIANGINLPPSEPDLLDRSLLLELSRIPTDRRRLESEVDAHFEQMRPSLLSFCFDTVSKAMTYIEEARRLGNFPRMADFAAWGCAVAKALGYSYQAFLDAYNDNIKRQNREAIEASPTASAIVYYLKIHEEINATPTKLLAQLDSVWLNAGLDRKDLPGSARSLGKSVRSAMPNLHALGYKVTFRKSNERRIIIEKPNAQNAQTSNSLNKEKENPDNWKPVTVDADNEMPSRNSMTQDQMGDSDVLDDVVDHSMANSLIEDSHLSDAHKYAEEEERFEGEVHDD